MPIAYGHRDGLLVSLLTMPGERLLVRGTPFVWRARAEEERDLVLQSESVRAVRFRIDRGRLAVGMVVAARESAIDISRQPLLLWSLLADAAVEHGCPEGQLRRRLSVELQDLSAARGGWMPRDDQLEGPRLTLGLSYPMLGPVVDGGARSVGEVPRWAAPLLAASNAREAAIVGFGAKATRRVVRVLPSSVGSMGDTSSSSIRLVPLGLAMMAREVLDADRLAALLERPAVVDVEPRWPDVDFVELGREQLPRLGAPRVATLLQDAATADAGLRLLRATLLLLQRVRQQLPARLPNGLEPLYELCRSVAPVDPAPREASRDREVRRFEVAPAAARESDRDRPAVRVAAPITVGQAIEPITAADGAERRVRELFGAGTTRVAPFGSVPSRALNAPSVHRPAASGPIQHDDRVCAIDGLDLGDDLQLVLPRTTAELSEWGRQLHNCVGTFASAAATGVSTIVGVRLRGRLVYCLELTASGEIRQFLGVRNRPVPAPVAGVVVRALLDHHLLDRHRHANAVWLAAM